MNHVLFLAYYFPPIAASGAMRPLGFCRYLQSYGWHASVVATSPESVYPPHPIDRQLESFVPSTVPVERVTYRDSLSRLIEFRDHIRRTLLGPLRRSEVQTIQLTEVESGISKQSGKLRSVVKDAILDWMFAFPDRQASWVGPVVKHIVTHKREHIPDIILATGGPWSAFVAARALARHYKRPLMLDYRDPWTCNPYYSFSVNLLTERARRLERSICLSASRIIANTVELRDRLCAEYPEISSRCMMIPNGYDEEILGLGVSKQADQSTTRNAGYELCHFGTVYGKRTPRNLFRAICDLWKDGVLKPEHLRLRFVGAWESSDEDCNDLALDLEKQGFLRREPPMPHAACIEEMKRASVLLVVQPDSPLQVPGKIYEYIATRRPLLLIGGEGATANLVRRFKLGVSCRNEIDQLKRLLRNVGTDQIHLHAPDSHCIAEFNYRKLAGHLAEALDVVLHEARR